MRASSQARIAQALVASAAVLLVGLLLGRRATSAPDDEVEPEPLPTYYVQFMEIAPQCFPNPTTAPMFEGEGSGIPPYLGSNWHRVGLWIYRDPDSLLDPLQSWDEATATVTLRVFSRPEAPADASIGPSGVGDGVFYQSSTPTFPLPVTSTPNGDTFTMDIPMGSTRQFVAQHAIDFVLNQEPASVDPYDEELCIEIVSVQSSWNGGTLAPGDLNSRFRFFLIRRQ